MTSATERINRAVADCLVLSAYSRKPPQQTAREYINSMRNDPTWDNEDVERVEALVLGLLTRLQRTGVDRQGWIK